MNFGERIQTYIDAIDTWGIDNQVFMVVEECGEVLNALAKFKRGRVSKSDVITELADVSIMMEQMATYFGLEEYINEKERKLKRLRERIETYRKNAGNDTRDT